MVVDNICLIFLFYGFEILKYLSVLHELACSISFEKRKINEVQLEYVTTSKIMY